MTPEVKVLIQWFQAVEQEPKAAWINPDFCRIAINTLEAESVANYALQIKNLKLEAELALAKKESDEAHARNDWFEAELAQVTRERDRAAEVIEYIKKERADLQGELAEERRSFLNREDREHIRKEIAAKLGAEKEHKDKP